MVSMKPHPTLGIMVRSDGMVLIPKNKAHDEHWTKGNKSHKGYMRVGINGKLYSVHRLVAETFIPNPDNKPCIDHNNRIKDDNDYNNLSWVTYTENNYNTRRNLLSRERKCDLSEKEYHRNAMRKFRKKKEVKNV